MILTTSCRFLQYTDLCDFNATICMISNQESERSCIRVLRVFQRIVYRVLELFRQCWVLFLFPPPFILAFLFINSLFIRLGNLEMYIIHQYLEPYLQNLFSFSI
jgi:hypothetical protein